MLSPTLPRENGVNHQRTVVDVPAEQQQGEGGDDRESDTTTAAHNDSSSSLCSPFSCCPSAVFSMEKGLTLLPSGATTTAVASIDNNTRDEETEMVANGNEEDLGQESGHSKEQAAARSSPPSSSAAAATEEGDSSNVSNDNEKKENKKRNENKAGTEDNNNCNNNHASLWKLQDSHPSTTLDLPAYALGFLLVGVLWLLLWSAFSSEWMAPGSGSPVFDPIAAILFSTFTGKLVCKLFNLPALVGIIWFSILWGHIYETGYLVSGIPTVVFFVVGRIGLTTILVRAGFALSWNVVRGVLFNAIALSLLPLVFESITHAIVARYIFFDEFDGGDWQWAFLQGFLCSVVSAAITVPGTIALQAQGYQRGVPPLIISSVGLDTATGVWVVSFLLSLVFDSSSGNGQSLGLRIALGPIQLVVGVMIGVLVGIGFHMVITRIAIRSLVNPLDLLSILKKTAVAQPAPSTTMTGTTTTTDVLDRYVLASFILVALAAVFFGNQVSLAGGGTILAITFGATVSHMWGYRLEQQTREIRRSAVEAMEIVKTENGDNSPTTERHRHTSSPSTSDDANEQQQPAEEAVDRLIDMDPTVQLNRFLNALKARLGGNLATLWDVIVLGPLFTMSGAKVKLVDIFAADFFWKGLVVFICAAAVRILVSCSCGFGLGLSKKEVGFIGLGWLGKASVQAAMGGIALQLATSEYDAEVSRQSTSVLNNITTSSSNTTTALAGLARRVVAAETVQNTSILFILISAPLCAIFVSKLGPTMLTKGTIEQSR